MIAAAAPRRREERARLMRIDRRTGALRDGVIGGLAAELAPGDLLVLNDAATIPASFRGTVSRHPVEIRLLRRRTDGAWQAVLFGEGDWRVPTEHRAAPPAVREGDVVRIADDLGAVVTAVSALSDRLVDLRFDRDGEALWSAIYRHGKPVQYSYLRAPLDLWSVQTRYGSRPWAVEAPSAGQPLTWAILREVAARGVRIATLTHAAGLSATGDATLDAALPLAESYEIPVGTVEEIAAARKRGGRVIAVGTTVVRALEGSAAANGGAVVAGEAETDLRLRPGDRLRVVDGILTGMHDPTASHFDLLQAFVAMDVLRAAYAAAEAAGYRCHEFGDSSLIV